MSREIKFRGMDANGVMRYGQLSQDSPGRTAYYKTHSQRICWTTDSGGDANIPVSNESLGQYTGLQSTEYRDGDVVYKDVYEGDVLEWEEYPSKIKHKAKVYYSEKRCAFELDTALTNLHCVLDELDGAVIGNVWENPELNKGENI
jgi:hypothetical protein